MLTVWGKKVAGVLRNTSVLPYVSISNNSVAYIEGKTIGGNTKFINATPIQSSFAPIVSALIESGSSSSYGVAFGSGNESPTENDVSLTNQIAGLAANTPTITTIFDSNNYRYVARLEYTINNDTGAEVTIREIGLFAIFGTAASKGSAATTTSAGRFSFMIDRTLLDTPVTIPNGTAGVVRYEFAY